MNKALPTPCATCAAPATLEVPFANEPHYEYYCEGCLPALFLADPISDRCDFCAAPSHLGTCPEMLAFVERVKARMAPACPTCAGLHPAWQCPEIRAVGKAHLDRIITNVLDRIAHPHPCPSCGDLTAADLCAACQEWECKQLDLDFAPIGWA